MAVTTKTYSGTQLNGITTDFAFSIQFIRDRDIKVRVNGTDLNYKDGTPGNNEYSVTPNSAKTAGTVTVNPAPTNTQTLLIYRQSGIEAALSTFTPGSTIRAVDLNNNTRQTLFFAQEAEDVNNPIISNSSGSSSSSFSIDDLNSVFTSKADGSLIYFDNTASTFKADNTTTKTNIVDGGNF